MNFSSLPAICEEFSERFILDLPSKKLSIELDRQFVEIFIDKMDIFGYKELEEERIGTDQFKLNFTL